MQGYEKDIIDYYKQIVFNKLLDMLLNDEVSLDENSVMQMALDIFELVDDAGKPIFKLNSDYRFDDNSIEVFRQASKAFLEECEDNMDIISQEQIEHMKNVVNLIEYTLKNKSIIKRDSKVRFITLPDPEYLSALISDMDGNGPNGFKFDPNSPSEISGVSNAVLILRELLQIEKVLQDDPDIIRHTGARMPFQSENNIQVKRNVSARLRIPIFQYGKDTIMIAGIFHKIGDNDPKVQNEYIERKARADAMKKDLNANVDECEKRYCEFKKYLISHIYGRKVDEARSVYRYFIEVSMKQMKEVGDYVL